MISFYPGPSRVYDDVPAYVRDAHKDGILGMNHRSDEFMRISERTIRLLKEKLNIPKAYTVLYTSSATECWEIIAQSLITKHSHHIFNGAFGQKWFEYTRKLHSAAKAYPFNREEAPDPKKYQFGSGKGVICLTQNETSNGTQVTSEIIQAIKKNNPDCLVAIDATSSMAGVSLDFTAADVWFASVQKCFGLPAGLGLLICSPKTLRWIKSVNEKDHYNSLTFMVDMMEKWQTPFTPNVLGIYMLMRVMENVKPVTEIHDELKKRYTQWIAFLQEKKSFGHLVANSAVHSHTVIPVAAPAELITSVKNKAKKEGILLGEGYGELKSGTFRIANFPALKTSEIELLRNFLKSFA